MAKALMFMGTGSDVGKSLIVAGLCRAYADRGLRVVPFKPQNMSNNAAVTADGGEIGRAQALQARAARRPAVTAMNPVLLKPEGETGAQLVVRGRRVGSLAARDYWARRGELLPRVVEAFRELTAEAELVLVEGAGSASEINLRARDIANFGFAEAAGLPVVVIGDIDRGGVIAALCGTFTVVAPEDRSRIVASIVNKFRGDPALFAAGRDAIAELTGVPCLGPVPWFAAAQRLPAEDTLALESREDVGGSYLVAVPRLPNIANFDDLDPLRAESNVRVTMIAPGRPLPQEADLIVLPGSKATRADLAALRREGWDIDIMAHHRAGKPVFGICGGYQMLGRVVADPAGLEGAPGESAGLGLLDVETVLEPVKNLQVVSGYATEGGAGLCGYQMHMGVTRGPATTRPFAMIGGEPEGATKGQVTGTYLHGVFASDAFRHSFLNDWADPALKFEAQVESTLDALAAHLERHLDLDLLLSLAAPA